MYRITLTCTGLTEAEGVASVADVLDEFAHRPWNTHVECSWSSGVLTLNASNANDSSGLALLDEFGDAVNACVNYSGPIRLAVVSVA